MPGFSDSIRAELRQRQLPNCAWSFLANGRQSALEPTCLALLALSGDSQVSPIESFLEAQCGDGSWRAFEGDEPGCGLAALALLTLNTLGVQGNATEQTLNWLLNASGREAHWPWKWKFNTTDNRVQFNPNKFGWPWQPGTCSWVVPTAFAVLALKKTFSYYLRRKAAIRIRHGVEMLLDRACPGGGWNAGNGVVYGYPMGPHVDATAIAMLALRTEPLNAIIESSLAWLERRVYSCRASWSLAWATLALDAYNLPVGALQEQLSALIKPESVADTATLAVVELALECDTRQNVFEVDP